MNYKVLINISCSSLPWSNLNLKVVQVSLGKILHNLYILQFYFQNSPSLFNVMLRFVTTLLKNSLNTLAVSQLSEIGSCPLTNVTFSRVFYYGYFQLQYFRSIFFFFFRKRKNFFGCYHFFIFIRQVSYRGFPWP